MEKESDEQDSKEVSRGRRERVNEERKDETEIAASKGGRRRRDGDVKEDTGNFPDHLYGFYSVTLLFA